MAPDALKQPMEWATAVYAAADAMDAEGYLKFLSPDVWFRFGNNPPAIGAEAASAALGGFLGAISSMKHEFVSVGATGSTVVIEADIKYGRKDGTSVTIPGTILYHIGKDGLAQQAQIFMDASPIFTGAEVPHAPRPKIE
ncbi:hypothetical protein DFJ74DRAFT_711485 [Hyaloraphidium curvatum]|nr:hypothetical protein DFJ74DRAFT_711485 [Hyaloraphidium curvatum]